MGMKVISTPLGGLFEVEHTPISDARGSFTRLFCEQKLADIRPGLHFSQINWSYTKSLGTVRGMHCQKPPKAEAKLIRCLQGRVFDVAVDLRANSPTFLQWHAVELSEKNNTAVFIPEGFAHGFQALSDDACLLYMHTKSWDKSKEFGVHYDDPLISIDWPLPIQYYSERDAEHQRLDANFKGLLL